MTDYFDSSEIRKKIAEAIINKSDDYTEGYTNGVEDAVIITLNRVIVSLFNIQSGCGTLEDYILQLDTAVKQLEHKEMKEDKNDIQRLQ